MITFNSLGHMFASFFKAVGKDAKQDLAVAAKDAPPVINAIEATKPEADLILPFIPVYGPLATDAADLGYAVLGEIAAILVVGDSASKQKLLDAGFDSKVLAAVTAGIKVNTTVATVATALAKL